MNQYYVLCFGRSFKILYMDWATAELWRKQGWELRSYDSNQKAQLAMANWEADVRKLPDKYTSIEPDYPPKQTVRPFQNGEDNLG